MSFKQGQMVRSRYTGEERYVVEAASDIVRIGGFSGWWPAADFEPIPNPKPTNRFQEGESLKCWIVVRVGADRYLAPGAHPRIHRSPTEAQAEAMRLGTENPGVRFIVFESRHIAASPPPTKPSVSLIPLH